MVRIRANYVFGETDAALTSGGTTLSSPRLADLPAVSSPDVAAITLHDQTVGTYEIVHVTAHAAASTTATIVRAQEGTSAAAWSAGTTWTHGLTVADLDEFAKKIDVPSIEEIAVSVMLTWPAMANPINRDTSTATRDCPLLSLPFDWYLLSVECLWGSSIGASDTDFWRVDLQNRESGVATEVIASKSTEATGGEAITGDKPWRFDSGTFDSSTREFSVDQALRITTTPTNPGATLNGLNGPSVAIVRYARL